MEITKYTKMEGKGALIAYFNIQFSISQGSIFFINDMKLFQKDGRRWIGFPDRKYEKDGETKYAPYCGFTQRNDAFGIHVVKALKSYWEKEQQKPTQQQVQQKKENQPSFEMGECPF